MVNRERLNRCFNPQSIAVVGGREAERVVQQSLKLGFQGPIWPVNPRRDQLAGVSCFSSIADLPDVPDVTFVAIPADPSIEVIGELNAMGAGGAVGYASGFREVGEGGDDRHHQLIEAAGEMPVIGPNCYGYINALCGAALWPDQMGMTQVEKGVAIFSSSGNIGLNLTLQQRSLDIAWMVSVGNQAVMGIEEGITAALDNDRITAIGLHIEGLSNLPLFIEVAEKARQKRIPIVVLKTGRSDIGAQITLSHTATLAGESGLYDALFERLGIGQVDTLEEFLETLKLVSVTGPLEENRIASMSCSGGEASLIADLAVDSALQFPAPDEAHRIRVKETLNDYVTVSNPLDYHTFIWADKARMTDTFAAMMSGDFDLTLLVLDYPVVNDCDIQEWIVATDALIEAKSRAGKKAAIVASLSENMPAEVTPSLIASGITPFHGMQQAISALEAGSRIGMRWQSPLPMPSLTGGIVDGTTIRALRENRAKEMLAQAGLNIPASKVVGSAEQSVEAASAIGYPVVVKALSDEIAHKTEMGAVAINLNTPEQVEGHAGRMLGFADQVLVEKMVESTVAELLIGVSYDPQFGHYLIIGFGGTLVELIGDRQILLFPTDETQIRQALEKLKTFPLLTGYRGRDRADINSIVVAVLKVAALVEREKHRIVELEINPLLVGAEGKGAVVADALIRLNDE